MLHFPYVFQILLLYSYLLVGKQIFNLQSSICLKIEHMISHCLFRVMSEHLLPPMHSTAFIFATVRVQLNVLEDKITGNATAPSFTQLNLLKKNKNNKKKWRLEHASSEQPKTQGQQELAAAMFPAEEKLWSAT